MRTSHLSISNEAGRANRIFYDLQFSQGDEYIENGKIASVHRLALIACVDDVVLMCSAKIIFLVVSESFF